ncbi:MAG: FAD:protein FMN transferase [Candidatus Moranbacteria bacterium]|nr:FAD:protein FMN transferase [bacterium]MDP1834160.1 FAD:protein FMN transferase [Candidatus Moranbacteria bacterium]MDZ4385008.1 FAD:protein FMN transferase [Candidatus Moranbacteria bacterium]
MNNSREKANVEFRAMGTDVSVEIVDGGASADGCLRNVEKIFSENEKIFSRFRKDSELTMLNGNLGKEIRVSDKMYEVLELCMKFYGLSEGYFDPRVLASLEEIGYDKDFRNNDLNSGKNKRIELEKIDCDLREELVLSAGQPAGEKTVLIRRRIDTTGIAKGYSVDEAARYLKKEGFKDFVVDAGGDMFASGADGKNESWRIGIEGLDDKNFALKLDNEGIATSGISRKRWQIGERKFHHLVNPKAPEIFSFEIKTVTVVEKKTVEADGRAKVLVIMGKEKGLRFANENGIKALFLDYRGNVYLSKMIKENIA